MSAEPLAVQMSTAARSLLASLDGGQRELAVRPFADDAARRWLEYRPRSRPRACIAELSGTARKAAPRPRARAAAGGGSQPRADIRAGTGPRASQRIEPPGVPAAGLGPAARALLAQLVALYLDRLPAELAAGEAARLDGSELHFAWEGPLTPGARHYYRVQRSEEHTSELQSQSNHVCRLLLDKQQLN